MEAATVLEAQSVEAGEKLSLVMDDAVFHLSHNKSDLPCLDFPWSQVHRHNPVSLASSSDSEDYIEGERKDRLTLMHKLPEYFDSGTVRDINGEDVGIQKCFYDKYRFSFESKSEELIAIFDRFKTKKK